MEHHIVGSWSLVSLRNTDAEGVVAEPYGASPQGQIMFTPDGNMSVIVTRASEGPDVPSLAFSGTYDVDRDADVVTYHVLVSIRPEQVGGDQQRAFRFDGDLMILNTPDRRGEIIWRRLAGYS